MNVFFAKASEAAYSARFLFELNYYDGATDRAFFAMFNVTRALLASRGMNADHIRSHTKVRALLKRHFIETGKLAPDLDGIFRKADKLRRVADVGPGNVGPVVAAEMIQSMDRFMDRAAGLLQVQEETP